MTKLESDLRVAILVPSLANMGPISVVKDIVLHIQPIVKEVKVFYFDTINELEFTCETEQISFSKKIGFGHFDIIHTHGIRPDLYLAYHRPKKIRRVTTLHSNVFEELISARGKVIGNLAAFFWVKMLTHHKIAVLSNIAKTFYTPLISNASNRLVTVYNGRDINQDTAFILPKEELVKVSNLQSQAKYIVGVVSVLNKRKGIHQLIEALSLNNELGLMVIGNGEEQADLEILGAKLNVDNRMLFLGYKSSPSAYHQYFDVFALTSYSEGMPLGLLEAIQLKSPCVVSNLDIYDELFSGDEILTYKIDDAQDLADKLILATQKSDSLVFNALKKVQSNYTPQLMAQKYLDLYVE